MIWIFAAVVLGLLVHSSGFRRFSAWLAGAAVIGAIITGLVVADGGKSDKAPAWTPPVSDVLPATCTDDEAAAAVKALNTNPACPLTFDQLADVRHHIAASDDCKLVYGVISKNQCLATMAEVYRELDAAQLSSDEYSAIRCWYRADSRDTNTGALSPQYVNKTAACVRKELHELAVSKGLK